MSSLIPMRITRSRSRSTSRRRDDTSSKNGNITPNSNTLGERKRRKAEGDQQPDSGLPSRKISRINEVANEDDDHDDDDEKMDLPDNSNNSSNRYKRSRSRSPSAGKTKKPKEEVGESKTQLLPINLSNPSHPSRARTSLSSSSSSSPSSANYVVTITSQKSQSNSATSTTPASSLASKPRTIPTPATETTLQANTRKASQGQIPGFGSRIPSQSSSSLSAATTRLSLSLNNDLLHRWHSSSEELRTIRKRVVDNGGAGDITAILNEVTNVVGDTNSNIATVTLPQLYSYQLQITKLQKEYAANIEQLAKQNKILSPCFDLDATFTYQLTPTSIQQYIDTLISSGHLYRLSFPDLVANNQLVIANLLLTLSPAHINQTDGSSGATGLIRAIRATPIDIQLIRYLLNHKADPTIADNEGNTALHHVMIAKNEEVLNLLLQIGAIVSIMTMNKAEQTPMTLARIHGFGLDFLSLSLSTYTSCSYLITQKHPLDQQFFECFTCGLTGDKGCCDTCIYRCHLGHVVRKVLEPCTGFCDCGSDRLKCKALSQPIVIIPNQAIAGKLPLKLPLPFPKSMLAAARETASNNTAEVKSSWTGEAFHPDRNINFHSMTAASLRLPLNAASARELLALLQEIVLIRKDVHLQTEAHRRDEEKQQLQQEEQRKQSLQQQQDETYKEQKAFKEQYGEQADGTNKGDMGGEERQSIISRILRRNNKPEKDTDEKMQSSSSSNNESKEQNEAAAADDDYVNFPDTTPVIAPTSILGIARGVLLTIGWFIFFYGVLGGQPAQEELRQVVAWLYNSVMERNSLTERMHRG